MQRRLGMNRGLIFLFIATVFAAASYHGDLIGRVSYAVERGRLQAGFEHLDTIDDDDVACLEETSHAYSVIADVVRPSVVNVEARAPHVSNEQLRKLLREHGFPIPRDHERRTPLSPRKGIGSGIILDTNGNIVTNNHVIAEAEVIEVTLADGRKYRAEVIGTDPMTDIAVLKIGADRLHPARLGDSDQTKVGHVVLAVGSPFTFGHSVSHGIISAMGRTSVSVNIDYQNWIQTDAPINPGNSGGPLINTRGEVIGINTAIASDSGGHQGVGFAIPSNAVARVAARLMSRQDTRRGYLGVIIKEVTPKVADAYGLDQAGGVFINNVGPGSPAAKAGLKPEDIILTIDGRRTETRERLQELIAGTEPGNEVLLEIWRGGVESELSLVVGAQPHGFSTSGSVRDLDRRPDDAEDDEEPEPEVAARPDDDDDDDDGEDAEDVLRPSETEVDFEKLGFSADTVSPELRRSYGIHRRIRRGAVITRVSATGEAYAAGLRPSMVIQRANDKRINNVKDLQKVLTAAAIAKGVRLKLMTDRNPTYTVMRVR